MGQRSCYERRQADIECFNGGDYERAINVTNCTCTDEDFEWSVKCNYSLIDSLNI